MLIQLENEFFKGIADAYGGELISLKDKNGMEYLWGGDEAYWVGRSPHLFPIIGTLKDQKISMNGRSYSMEKHGFARNTIYEVVEQTKTTVTFLLKDTKETKQKYPFTFSFYVTHTLQSNGFTTSYRIVNEGKEEMPFCVGGHTGVRCPIKEGESFADYQIQFERPVSLKAYRPASDDPIKKISEHTFLEMEDHFTLYYDLFAEGPIIFNQISEHTLKLINPKSKMGVGYTFEGFPVLALWTLGKKQAPYLCLEPWHGLPAFEEDGEELREKPYSMVLRQGEEKTLSFQLRVLQESIKDIWH